MMQIAITKNTATARLAGLAWMAKNPRAIIAAGAQACVNHLRSHMRGLDKKHPNKIGGKRSHFWNTVARSCHISTLTALGAVVTVSDPRYAHKVTGGDIEAKRVKYLAIPVSVEAYGLSPRVFTEETGIELAPIGSGNSFVLAEIVHENGLETVRVHYILRKSVHQEPQSDALPNMKKMRTEIMRHAEAAARRQARV